MPQIGTEEFERLPLRVHDVLAGVQLHDVWAVDLPRSRPGITLDEFQRLARARRFPLPPVARGLLACRFFLGRLFGWDREPASTAWETFSARLTPADRSMSLVPVGTSEGRFRVVYRFENEQLLEIVNRTVHAAALTALVETPHAYRWYFAVYVHSIGFFTPIYMVVIDPFRKWLVYPSLLRGICAAWDEIFGTLSVRDAR
jgi:Protein of unknown function (DUF2867)